MDTVKFVNVSCENLYLHSWVNLGLFALIDELGFRHKREFKSIKNRVKILIADSAVADKK